MIRHTNTNGIPEVFVIQILLAKVSRDFLLAILVSLSSKIINDISPQLINGMEEDKC